MEKVSLLKCDSYSDKVLKKTLAQSLANIGFDAKRFKNARVAVKPNLLMPAKDEKAITTHPAFFRAAVQIIKENGGRPVLVESPAVHSLERLIKKTDYARIVAEEGIEVADPDETATLHFEGAEKFKHIDISRAYFDADIIVSLPKFKTHGITYITGGVKLLFGAIPGLEKSKMHFRLPAHDDFADFLLDLYGAFRYGFNPPKVLLNLMDAIVVQEGEGPGPAGRPRVMNAVLAGENAIAVDYIATRTAGLDVKKVRTITGGFQRRYGPESEADIEIVGDALERLALTDFEPATGSTIFSNMFKWPLNTKTFKNLFLEHPVPKESRCSLCYQCMKICPAGAISVSDGKTRTPAYDYGECIRCYCCLEICPEAAIEKQQGRLQWTMDLINRIR